MAFGEVTIRCKRV